jgi:hypothetical protein
MLGNVLLSDVMLSIVMQIVIYFYAECHYTKCHLAECYCIQVELRGLIFVTIISESAFKSSLFNQLIFILKEFSKNNERNSLIIKRTALV